MTTDADVGLRVRYVYCLWAVIAMAVAVAAKGLSLENITRILVVAFLLAQIAFRSTLVRLFPQLPPRTRFVVLGTLLAAVVEGLHMISMPVFPSLRISSHLSITSMLCNYLIDLSLTVPAYLAIFATIWFFITKYSFGLWTFTLVMGIAQTLGDGGLMFFASAPAMLLFLPYPMTNYHAVNVIPFLAVRDELAPNRSVSHRRFLAIPAVVLVYFVCGALIQLVGRASGLTSAQ